MNHVTLAGEDGNSKFVDGVVVDVKYGVKQGGQKLRKGPSLKSLNSGEKFEPYHALFCRNIKIRRTLRSFWKSVGKKVL